MIKTLELCNFQSHRFTSLNLHQGVNVIKGRSHSGKTSIIRALRWALSNKPEGEAFRNWNSNDKDEIKVAIEFDDTYVIRTRSKKMNGYRLPGTELNAIGRELPSEVSQLSRMNDLNLQNQHDTYFMLQDSASSALKRLNKVVGIDIIDSTLKTANGRNYTLLNEVRSTENRLKELSEEIQALDYLDFAGKLINKIDETLQKLDTYRKELIALGHLVDSIHKLYQEIDRYDTLLAAQKDYEKTKDTVRHLQSLKRQKSDLTVARNDAVFYENKIDELDPIVKLEGQIDSHLQDAHKIERIRSERVSLKKLCSDIQMLKNKRRKDAETLIRLQNEYDTILSEAGVCPLCGRGGTCPHCGEIIDGGGLSS